MAQVTVTIGAISRSVLPGSLNISQTLFQRSTCEFSIPDRNGDIVLTVGEPVTVKELDYVWFAGTITEVERVKSVAGSPRYLRVRAVDYSQTCDRRITGSRSWSNAKLTTIVRDIALESLDNEGIDLSLVPPNQGPVVAEFKVDYEPVSDALNRLCSQVSAYWRIDKSKRLIAQEFSAGFVAGAISDVSGNVVAGSLQSRETREQFANHVIVRFNNLVGTYTKSFTGDGIKKAFDVDHEIVGAPQISIGSADDPENYTWVSVQVEGSSEPDPNAEYYTAYWSAGSKTITFNKPLEVALPMEVTYKGKSVDMRDVISADSINARKVVEGNSGVYTKLINIDQEITPQTAEEIANAAISRFVQLSTTVTFESDQLIASPGDKITSSFSGVPAGTYVVRGVRTSLVGKDLVRSAIEMSSGNLILDGMESLGALAGYVPGVGSLPITSDVEPAFPNITSFVVVPSQVEIDGVLKYKLEGSYTVPASTDSAKFGGVHLYLRDSGRIIDLGYQPTSVAAGQTATFTVILRLPPADTDWTLYAVARDKRRSNVFDPTSTPQATIQAKAKPLIVFPDVANFHAGTEIGGVWTTQAYWDDIGSTIHIDWSADVPADTMNWTGLVLWLRDGSGEFVQATGTEFIASGTLTGTLTLSSEFIPASGSYTVIASSCDRDGNVKRVGGNPAGPSTTVSVPARPAIPGGGVVKPADLTTNGWSMTIAEYGATLTGQPQCRVRITITERPANTQTFTAWLYRGATPTADRSGFWAENNTPISASGDTYLDLWLDQESASYPLQVAIVPSGNGYERPTASTVVKSITMPAVSPSAQPTDFTVTLETRTVGGQKQGAFLYYFPAMTDPNFYYMRIDRVFCDANYNPIHSWQIGVAEIVHGNDGSSQQRSWWNYPTSGEYWKFRAVPVTRALVANLTNARTFNLTVPKDPGALVAIGQNLVVNAGFEQLAYEWHVAGFEYQPAGRGATVGCMQYTGVAGSGDGFKAQLRSKVIPVSPGKEYTFEVWFYGQPGTNGLLDFYLHGWDLYISTLTGLNGHYKRFDSSSATGGWIKYTATATITEPNIAFVEVVATVWNTTTGLWLVDDFSFTEATPLGRGVTRNKDGQIQLAAEGDNLLANGGFEDGMKNWLPSGNAGTAIYSQNGYGVRSGTLAIAHNSAADQTGGKYQAIQHAILIPTESAAQYTLELYCYSHATVGNVRIYLENFNAAQTYIGATHNVEITAVSAYGTWKKITAAGAVMAGAAYIRPTLLVLDHSSGGPLLLDDFRLVRSTTASEIVEVPMDKAINVSTEFTTSGGQFKMLNVDFSKAINFNSSDFEKEPGSNIFKVKALSADKIRTGILEVGGGIHSSGASNRVSRFKVFDNFGNLIGWVGDDTDTSGYVGAWFKRIMIGGTSPASAKIAADANGNVLIDGSLIAGTIGATVAYLGTVNANKVNAGVMTGVGTTLSQQNITTTINTEYDSSIGRYAPISVKYATNNVRTLVEPGGVVMINANNTQGLQLLNNLISVRDTNGIQTVSCDGSNGWVSTTNGYVVGATQVIDSSRNGSFNSLTISGNLRVASYVSHAAFSTPTTYTKNIDVYTSTGQYLGFLIIY